MKKATLLLVTAMLFCVHLCAQEEGSRIAARSNAEAYDDENSIIKLAYRESPYFMELTGRWDQKKTDSSVVYSRDIEVAKYWKDYQVSLNVRCGRACRVMLNGKTVGYGGDSRHWNEFALNAFFKYGKKNVLAIEALKNSREAMLESQDQMEGLNGEPYLLFKGDPNVSDIALAADYDATLATGTLSLDINVFNSKKKGKYYVEVEVWDPKGHSFDRMGRWVVFEKKNEASVDISRSWGAVEPWSAETPKLYTVVIRLRNEEMEEEEVVGARFGFRRVEVKDGLLLLNGKPITLKGVTYGTKQIEGLAARERMKQDLLTMKKLNINAVRTAKYSPMDPYFYQLCDELGLYVVCDANLLPWSTQQHAVATDKDFIPLFERRIDNLYGKYKNHPSIIAWSLGESNDNGICMTAAYKRLKYLDKSRPVIFAGADYTEYTDIIALLYPSEKDLRQSMGKTSDRPFLMLASVRNDNFTDMENLWEMVESRRNLQGGFADVWPLSGAKQADLKNLFSPFDVHLSKTTIDDAEFTVYNRNDFANFSDYILEYTIFTNNRPNISAGDLPMAIDGGGVESVKLRIPPVDLQSGEEMMIRFDLERRNAPLAERLMGTKVFELPYKNSAKTPLVNTRALTVDSCDVDNTRGLSIRDKELALPDTWFKTTTAQIKGYYYRGLELVNYSPMLHFARHDDWTREVVAVTHRSPDANTVCIDAMLRYQRNGVTMCDARVTYTFFGSGDIVVDYTLSPTDAVRGDLVPLVDVNLPKWDDDTLQWFGLDREVCFAKRNSGVLGTYTVPREQMNATTRQQVRWCVDYKGLNDNIYVALIGEPFTMDVNGNKLTLHASKGKKTIRLHMRGFERFSPVTFVDLKNNTSTVIDTIQERPEDFYSTAMPVVKSGIIDPPLIKASAARFSQPLEITITSPVKADIRYTLDGSEPTETSPLYSKPILLTATTVVKARAFAQGLPPSFTAIRKFNYDYIVSTTFSRKPNTPFNVGTDTILFDGETGQVDDLSQGWLGFSGDGVTTTVNLAKPIDVDYITLRFAHSPDMWAFAPRQVTVLLSTDGSTFSDTLQVPIPFDPTAADASEPQVVVLRVPVAKAAVAALKVEASSIGTIPAWHRGKGLKPWLMVDEITVSESTIPLNTEH